MSDRYVRQLWDRKGSAAIDAMELDDLTTSGRTCGHIPARAHARTGGAVVRRPTGSAIAIAATPPADRLVVGA